MRTLRRTIEASGASRESLGRSIAIAEASSNRIKGDAMAAQARMHAQAEAEVLAASDNVGRWKGGGETEKLRSRAEGAEAYAAWKAAAQRTVDNAMMRYFIVHMHKLLDPDPTHQPPKTEA